MNYFIAPTLFGLAAIVMAQPSQVMDLLPPVVVERGPHHRVIEQAFRFQTPSGEIAERKRYYTELGTGLQFWNGEKWSDSDTSIELFDGYAAALRGQVKAVFLANINSSGAIELTYEGRRFASHLVALLYTDAFSGQSVIVAQIQDSIGEVQPDGKVLYRDAFSGCNIDVLYTYSLAGVEQDLLIREQLPSPWHFGIDPQFARIEAVTEFLNPDDPEITELVWERNVPPEVRAAMAEPDLVDQTLRFGTFEIGPGGAFAQEENQPKGLFNDVSIPISKRWIPSGQRRFLFEIVDWAAVEPELSKLPQAAALPRPGARDQVRRLASRELMARSLGRPPERQAHTETIRMASVKPFSPGKSLVWDYAIAISQTNMTFKGDTTYFVRSDVQLSQTTRIEGGAVFKFTNSSTSARLFFKGPVQCLTSPQNPAFFTSMSDCTVGEIISTNAISGYYGTRLMDFSASGQDFFLHDLKLRYGLKGLVMSTGTSSLSATNIQIIDCSIGLEANGSYTVNLFNGLMAGLGSALGVNSSATVRGEHITFRNLTNFRSGDSSAWPNLTNCLIIVGGGRVAFNGENVQTNLSDSGVFQTVGAGAHYLADGSIYRDAGTTNINPALALALRGLSTHPPVVLTNAITQDTVLSPQAPRDTDIPDLGWHYLPIDFAMGSVVLTNATLLLTNGIIVATYGGSSNHGLRIDSGGKLISEGSADRLNWIVRYNMVQEQANTNWSSTTVAPALSITSLGSPVQDIQARFTGWSMVGGYHMDCQPGSSSITSPFGFTHCQFYGGGFHGKRLALGLTNCLWHRVSVDLEQPSGSAARYAYNNLFYGGSVDVETASGSANFYDNLFDLTTLTESGSAVTHGYNGYVTNANRFTPNQGTDVILTLASLDYQVGTLSWFYYPTNGSAGGLTNLFNKGSRNATNAALAHLTVRTDQLKESSSTVDIGWHLVAMDANSQLADYDTDGLPDYQEDRDGDMAVDTGETNWQDDDTDGDGVSDYLEWLQGRDPLTEGAAAGSVVLILYTPVH